VVKGEREQGRATREPHGKSYRRERHADPVLLQCEQPWLQHRAEVGHSESWQMTYSHGSPHLGQKFESRSCASAISAFALFKQRRRA
jgi:hypothetical protein